MQPGGDSVQSIAEILAERPTVAPADFSRPASPSAAARTLPSIGAGSSAFEGNLAQFPFAVLGTKLAKKIKDITVTGRFHDRESGQRIPYKWVVKGASGLPGPLGQDVFYGLLQHWYRHDPSGTRIPYGSVRSFLFDLGYRHHPGLHDAEAFTDALKALVGLQIDCENCFFDALSGRRFSLTWHPFSRATYPANSQDYDQFSPNFFVELDPFFAGVLRTNSLWVLPFSPAQYHELTPLRKRFAILLSKMLKLFPVYDVSLADLIQLGPIHDRERWSARRTLKRVFQDLLALRLPAYFKDLRHYRGRDGSEVFRFVSSYRRHKQDEPLTAEQEYDLQQIIQAVGNDRYRNLWIKRLRAHGHSGVERALGLLRDQARSYRQQGKAFSSGKILDTIFLQDLGSPPSPSD